MVIKKKVQTLKCYLWQGVNGKWYFLTKVGKVICAQKYTRKSNAVRAAERFGVKTGYKVEIIPIK